MSSQERIHQDREVSNQRLVLKSYDYGMGLMWTIEVGGQKDPVIVRCKDEDDAKFKYAQLLLAGRETTHARL